MKKSFNIIFSFCLSILVSAILLSCSKKDGPEPPSGLFDRTVLLYAVASNNLYSSILDDMKEILRGAGDTDNLNHCAFMLYLVTPDGDNAYLQCLEKLQDGSYSFSTVKEYSRDVWSTDPRRLSEVISDVASLRPAEKYGLILWSHGTGWTNDEVLHPAQEENPSELTSVKKRSFGMDKYLGGTDYMNIHELASAIPSGMFDFIWFDACYMSGIETIYQLRNKCDIFVGYPTEVWSPGMPYDQTLPLILKKNPNLVGAADLFSDYYKKKNDAYTIAVVRTASLPSLAEAARNVYSFGGSAPATSSLVLYSRRPCGPFYDFGQFTEGFSLSSDSDSVAVAFDESKRIFKNTLKDCILYKSASEFNFLYPGYGVIRDEYMIPAEDFSGMNCHWFDSPSDVVDFSSYYMSLDWYKDVIAPAAAR